jgi:hypothetical protein
MLASYPALQLLAHNILQVDPAVVVRPILWSLAGASFGYLMIWLLLRDRHRAALMLCGMLVLFFAYGHLYEFLRENSVLGLSLGRHRYLLAGYVVLLIIGLWAWRRRLINPHETTAWLNLVSVTLLALPVAQLVGYELRVRETSEAGAISEGYGDIQVAGLAPDVYYIVLDGYGRADALREDLNYDNSAFLTELEKLGFYVAECSRSNYAETLSSLTSSLNMNYLPELRSGLREQGLDGDSVFVLIKENQVMKQFASMGYRTVSFQTSFDWSDIRAANLYLALDEAPINPIRSSPFEVLFAETTAVKLLLDSRYVLTSSDFGLVDLKHRGHIELQRFILDELPNIAAIPEPTFTFAHILIPHTPYVFAPDGEIRTDQGFFGGEASGPINEDYLVRGYTGQITFINEQMLEIVRALIKDSQTPPVILLQSDHGFREDNKLLILNAYFVPEDAREALYSRVSPVNSFRLVFDRIFGAEYDLLPDLSYPLHSMTDPVPETSSICADA